VASTEFRSICADALRWRTWFMPVLGRLNP
jgi:hypothetical protein